MKPTYDVTTTCNVIVSVLSDLRQLTKQQAHRGNPTASQPGRACCQIIIDCFV